jgi:hypothetical protein
MLLHSGTVTSGPPAIRSPSDSEYKFLCCMPQLFKPFSATKIRETLLIFLPVTSRVIQFVVFLRKTSESSTLRTNAVDFIASTPWTLQISVNSCHVCFVLSERKLDSNGAASRRLVSSGNWTVSPMGPQRSAENRKLRNNACADWND